MENRRGQTSIFIFLGVMIMFGIALLLMVLGTVTWNMQMALDQNVTVGQVNLATINSQTFSLYNSMIVNHADFWGLCVIFGTIFSLLLTSYFTRNRFPKLGIVLDIFVVVTIFWISQFLSSAYSQVVVALSSAGQTFAEVSLNSTSFFLLNLHIFVAIIGVMMMILCHSGFPQKKEELNMIANISA